tara:strand:+ start:2263 stop:2715 length:453 start_codon:yes stop_codon:yes gene_type:complete
MISQFSTPDRQRITLLASLLVCVTFSAGCGSGTPDDGKVRNDVTISITYGGEAVAEGRVDLEDQATGEAGGGELNDSGSVTIENIVLGNYVVTVVPPMPDPRPPEPGQAPPVPKKYPNIPEKYRRAATSPLKAEVTAESTEFQFDLKDAN